MRVALAGLRFGAEFVPIYLHHPAVTQVTIVDSDPAVLKTIGDRFQIERRATDLADVLRSREIDAVHLVTPIPYHARQTLAVLEAGKQLRLHRADGHEPRGPQGDRRAAAALGPHVHDDGDRGLHPRVPAGPRDARPRRDRPHPAPAGLPLPGHGELAVLLDGAAADALRHPRHGAALCAAGKARALCPLLRQRDDAPGAARAVRQPLSGRDRDLPLRRRATSQPR